MRIARKSRQLTVWGSAMVLTFWLAGCGFHLQGRSPLPDGVERMSVSYHDNYSVGDPALLTALKQRLRRQHLLGDSGAPAELDIVSVDRSQRTLAVSPVDGDSAVYEITVRVVFNYSVRGATQMSGETLSTSRDFTTDATQRLSSDDESERLTDQMQNELANRILERIAIHNHEQATSADTTAS